METVTASSTQGVVISGERNNRERIQLQIAPSNGRGEVGLTRKEMEILKGAIKYMGNRRSNRKTLDWVNIHARYMVDCRKLVNDTSYNPAIEDNKVYTRTKKYLRIFHRDNPKKFN